MGELTAKDLVWGDVFHGLSLMRFGDAIQVNIITGTTSLSFSLSPDEAGDVAAKLQLLKEIANAPASSH